MDYDLLCNLLNFSLCIIILISVLILTIKMIHSKWEKEFILKTLIKKRQSDYTIVLSFHLFLCYIKRCWKVLSLTNFLKFNQVTKYLNIFSLLNSSLLGQEFLCLFFVLIVLWGWWIPEDLGAKNKRSLIKSPEADDNYFSALLFCCMIKIIHLHPSDQWSCSIANTFFFVSFDLCWCHVLLFKWGMWRGGWQPILAGQVEPPQDAWQLILWYENGGWKTWEGLISFNDYWN